MQAGRLTVTPSELMKLSVDLDNTQRALAAPGPQADAGSIGSAAVAGALSTFNDNWNYYRRALAERMHSLAQNVFRAAEKYSEVDDPDKYGMNDPLGLFPVEPLHPFIPKKLEPAHLLLAEPDADLKARFVADWKDRGDGFDQWGFAYNPRGDCTSYVAWRLNDLAKQQGLAADYFKNDQLDQTKRLHFGNAATWNDQTVDLARRGLATSDGTPQPGAVAWWEASSANGHPSGHVAIVRSVNADGSITVEEGSWDQYTFQTETIHPGETRYPTAFLHLVPNT